MDAILRAAQQTREAQKPPIPPPCDLECQKQKQLQGLQTALDAAAANKKEDPQAYENARVAYYTLANGQGWLSKEKERIAKKELEPVLSGFATQYESLKGEQKSHSIFSSLARVLTAQQEAGVEDNDFLDKRLNSEKDREKIYNRSNELGGVHIQSYIPIILDVILAILGISVLYFCYTKFDRLKELFGFRTEIQSFPDEY